MAVTEQIRGLLTELAQNPSVNAVLLFSENGLPLESVINDEKVDAEEVAAVARDGIFHLRKMLEQMDGYRLIQAIVEHTAGSLLFANLPYDVTLVIFLAKGSNKGDIWNSVVARFPRLIKAV